MITKGKWSATVVTTGIKHIFLCPLEAVTAAGRSLIIIIIVIAFKGAIRDYLQSPHSAANCLQHVRLSGPGAVVCKSCATHWALITCKCRVTGLLVGRDSLAVKFDRVEVTFILVLFDWLNHWTHEGGEETGVPGENPWRRASENATY